MSDNFLKDTELRRVEWTRGGWQESSGVTQLRDAGVGNGAGMAVAQEGLPGGKAQSQSTLSPAIYPSHGHSQSFGGLEGSMLSCRYSHLSPHGPSPSTPPWQKFKGNPNKSKPFLRPTQKKA